MASLAADRSAHCQHAAELLALLEAEGASPRFFQGFEEAPAEVRRLLLTWLAIARPKRARGAP
jgi:hypothetical protein